MMSGFRDDGSDAPFEGEPVVAEEQLTLADEDERLPWLESDEDYEEEGVDTARVVMFALAGLVAVLALVGVGWWLTQDSAPEEQQVATGGTIEAPDEPYKTRPEDAGGEQVEGTGDVSFGVGEGQRTEGVVRDNAPAPSIDRQQEQAEDADEAPEPRRSRAGRQPAVRFFQPVHCARGFRRAVCRKLGFPVRGALSAERRLL